MMDANNTFRGPHIPHSNQAGQQGFNPAKEELDERARSGSATGEETVIDHAYGRQHLNRRSMLLWLSSMGLFAWFMLVITSATKLMVPIIQAYVVQVITWRSPIGHRPLLFLSAASTLVLALFVLLFIARPRLARWALALPSVVLAIWLAGRAHYLFYLLGVFSAWFSSAADSYFFVLFVAAVVLLLPLLLRVFWPRLAAPALAVGASALTIALAVGAQALTDLLLLLWLTLACYELGRVALEALRLPPSDRLEWFILCGGLGSGLMALLGLFLGLVRLLTLPVILSVMVALSMITVIRWSRVFLRLRATGRTSAPVLSPPIGWLELTLLGITAGYLIVGYTMGLAPELMSDAVRVHLAMARIFADQHAVTGLPYMAYASWPIHGQLLFTIGMSLHGPILAKLIHTAAGAFSVAAVGLVGRRYAGARAGLVAAAIIAALPITLWELGTGYIDMFPVLYVGVGALCLLRWQEAGGWRWLLLLGAALGFGFASKLTLGFTAVAFGLALVLLARSSASLRERAQGALLAGLGGLLASGPWLVRSILLGGELPGLSLLFDALGRGTGPPPASLANLPEFGLGRGVMALLKLPWNLTINSSFFGENGLGFIGFAFLLLLPLLVLLRPRRTTLALALLVVFPFLLWFYSAQYLRYLLPTLALLAVLLGAAFVRLQEWDTPAAGISQRFTARLFKCGLVYGLLISIVFYLATILAHPGTLPIRLVLGQQSPQAYLSWKLSAYAVMQRLDQQVPPGAAVAVIPEGPQLYSHTTLLMPFISAPYLVAESTIPELVAHLREHGISYLVLDRNIIPSHWESMPVLQPDFLERYCQIVYAARSVYLYRLYLDGAPPGITGAELLQNPSFEQGHDGAPTYWHPDGSSIYDTSGLKARTGSAAVLSKTSSGYTQRVSIQEGHSYLLSCFVRSDQPGAQAHLQINWLGANGEMLSPTIEVVPARPEYVRRTIFATAPPGAAYANVCVATSQEAPCWFDDYSLKEAP